MNEKFEDLKRAHSLLMSRYIDVLNHLLDLPFFVKTQFKAGFLEVVLPEKLAKYVSSPKETKTSHAITNLTSFFSLRYLVRLFVESHIRGKLLEMSVAYSYLAQKHLEDKEYVTWLRETSEDCTKLAGTLTSWQSLRGILSIWWPFIISVVTAWLGLNTIYDLIKKFQIDASVLILLGFIMVFPLIYLSLFISSSFESKRELFMPGFDRTEKPLDPDRPAEINNITYYLEDQVFYLAGRRKAREIPLDLIGLATGSFVIALTPILVWMDEPSSPVNTFLWLPAAFFGLIGITAILYERRRKWR